MLELDQTLADKSQAQKKAMVVLSDWQEIIQILDREPGWIALDLETSGLRWWYDRIAVIALYGPATNTAGIIHLRGGNPDPRLMAWLEDPKRKFITHNGTCFDWPFLSSYGLDFRAPETYDTLIGEQVILTVNRKDVKVNLKDTLQRRLGVAIPKNVDHATWMQPSLDPDQMRYLADDIFYLPRLREEQLLRAGEQDAKWQKPGQKGVRDALAFEQKLAPIVTTMVIRGLPIDLDGMVSYTANAMAMVPEHEAWLLKTLGIPKLGYAPVVRDGLNRVYDLDIPDTRADTIKLLSESEGPVAEAAQRLLAYRKGVKRDSMYDQDFIEKFCHSFGGRTLLYGSFVQAGTDTGRFSSYQPNLQQIPRDMRHIVRDVKGELVISAFDFSAIEVRVAADLFQDQALLEALEAEDIHTMVASSLFGVPPEEVSKEQRRLAKAGSFNIIFGGGSATVHMKARADGAKVSRGQVDQFCQQFLTRFHGIARARERAFWTAGQGRPVPMTFPTGLRKILVPGPELKGTTILNNTVQATAAAGLKQALILMDEYQISQFLAAVIHDETLTTPPKDVAEEVSRLQKKAMLEGMAMVTGAPVAVEGKGGESWG